MSLMGTIERLCLKQLGRLPDLANPTGYNDKIQWLKLHDQRREQTLCCDKWAVREWVASRAGTDVLVPAKIGRPETLPSVMKCTHDSGSAELVRDEAGVEAALERLSARLSKPYGVDKGEWAYRFVPPAIVAEKALSGPITDYKFHCVHGRIAWVQVIWDRANKPKEAIFEPDGRMTDLHMDEKMVHCPDEAVFPGVEAWGQLSALTERLAAGWRYVRVDLYWTGKPLFGELTFWPRAGCYRSKDEPMFGAMLAIDRTEKMEPVVV